MEPKEFWKTVFSTCQQRQRRVYLKMNPEVGRASYYRKKYGVQAAAVSELQMAELQWRNACRT